MSAASGPWLAIDTATDVITVAVGVGGSALAIGRASRTAGGLLDMIDRSLAQAAYDRRDLRGVVVGTGPGSFTGLRVGTATAKTMAHELDIAILGVPTAEGLARAAVTYDVGLIDRPLALLMPAGARDHYLTRLGCTADECVADPSELLPPDADMASAVGGAVLIAIGAIDPALSGPDARVRGEAAVDGLAAALLAICFSRLGQGGPAGDAATLVPDYVALPRGLLSADQGMGWSPDLR